IPIIHPNWRPKPASDHTTTTRTTRRKDHRRDRRQPPPHAPPEGSSCWNLSSRVRAREKAVFRPVNAVDFAVTSAFWIGQQSPDRESISRMIKVPDPCETKQHFIMSFNKMSPSMNGDPSNGENHIAQLHAVPGFTYFVDGSPHKAKTEGVRHYSSSLNKSCDSNEIRNGGVHLPPIFDEELDESSVAALSAAALKKAVEQAEESIKIAKMIMERKKERFMDGSLESRSKHRLTKEWKKIRVETGAEGMRENGGAIKGGLNKRGDSEVAGKKVEVSDACARDETGFKGLVGNAECEEAKPGVEHCESSVGRVENAGKCEKEFLEHDEMAYGEHLKEVNGDLLNKLGSSVEEHVAEQGNRENNYGSGLEMKGDSPHRKSAEEELGKMEPEISRGIGKQVDKVHEVETDEKKPSFEHDGQKLCEEYMQDIQIEEKENSNAQNSKISLDSEETDNTGDENRDTLKFQVNDEVVDDSHCNNSGFNETHSSDTMTISSDSSEQSDVDSNNEAEENQPDGPSLGSKTENTGLMNGHEEHIRTSAVFDQTFGKEGPLGNKEEPVMAHEPRESEENTNGITSSEEELKNIKEQYDADQNSENNERISKEKKDPKANEGTFQVDDRQQRIEAIKRGREREKDRIAVERAIREARERAFAEARERAERGRAARERDKAAEGREKPADKMLAAEAKIRVERAAVERATTEARERALEKARSHKTSAGTRAQAERCPKVRFSCSSRSNGLKHSFSSSVSDLEKADGNSSESAQRRKARLERHQRTMERAAKALAEKNMRDFLAQKEQAERNRLAESLDADIRRWVTGKEGNLRALLSTLQYILGPDSGWQSVSLTEIITTAAVKKAYRKATLCVHPDKLQQRGANIHQKYICEKVFDLLKAAWNRFDSEER
ncbi:Chaperone DnaJ-domain superfamily protein, partial [Striga hermonthica]